MKTSTYMEGTDMSNIFQLDDAGLAAGSKQEQFLREAAHHRLLRSVFPRVSSSRAPRVSSFSQPNSLRPLHRPS